MREHFNTLNTIRSSPKKKNQIKPHYLTKIYIAFLSEHLLTCMSEIKVIITRDDGVRELAPNKLTSQICLLIELVAWSISSTSCSFSWLIPATRQSRDIYICFEHWPQCGCAICYVVVSRFVMLVSVFSVCTRKSIFISVNFSFNHWLWRVFCVTPGKVLRVDRVNYFFFMKMQLIL